ncbi:zinc metalloprotease [Sphingomonas piscis]|uniref:Zinc metalloprotease n=1 Tax=Sphingomonas piscis TaxID=2714943 RepID=A0A6G7YNE4_9SPHN|nr:neutral zinc metallopeptidase [Sphingomonas piscis]QIK78259.1 zinc metalloprotease [Sphingomonas piscis]
MRLGDEDPSGNFIDNTGRGGGFGLGGGGGNMLGCLLPMVMSRFGIVGVLVLLLGYCALSTLGGGGGLIPTGPGTTTSAPGQPNAASSLDPQMRDLMTRVLGSTERRWTDLFARSGQRYTPTTLVAYSTSGRSGCGAAQAAMGPFYCPTDQRIYIDPDFFNELSRRFGAPGDFAMAYVIAHEVGHHVQNLEGTLERAQNAQARSSEAEGNAVQVGVELQADCYAGVWAANDKNLMEAGDFEEGMKAAEAIGDDTLTQGRVSPDKFTHGTSAQRMAALRKGLETGNPAACTFNR